MHPQEPALTGRPFWLSSANLVWAGLAAVLLVLLLGAGFATYQRHDVTQQELHRMQLMARLLDNETSRTLDAASLTMDVIMQRLRGSGTDPVVEPDLHSRLGEAVRGLPYLRSLSLLDASGQVLVSSNPAIVNQSIDIRTLGLPASSDEVWLGPWLPGRDLTDTAHHNLPGVGVITLARRHDTAGGRQLYLVAAINPDFLANQFQQVLNERTLSAALLDYQGRVLTSTEGIQHSPGTSVHNHKALRDYLPDQEYGAYQGTGIDGTAVISAFRASRKHPLVIVVEESADTLTALWRSKLGWALAAVLMASLALVAGTLAGWRNLREHEQLSAALERTRTRLEDSERHLRAVIEAAPAPMFVLDPNGTFALVNQAFEDFLGVRRDDLIGHRTDHIPTLRNLSYHPVHDVNLWTGSGGQSNYMEGIAAVDGTLRQALVAKVALQRPDGRPGGVIGSITDVTSFREAERRAAEAMAATQSAYQAESEFIGNLSYALRTPLQSILGFSELGIVRTGDTQPGLNDMFTNIHTGSRRMLQVVDDLLDLSRLKNAAGTLHFAATDTRALIEEVIRHTDEQARRRGIRIELSSGTDNTVAEVSALRLQQALRTVLERAIRVSPDHSRVEIRLSRDGADTLHWWIHDAGKGIPEADSERQFDAFNPASQTGIRPEDRCSGLELAICREILRSHGGDVQCTSNPSGGIFHLFLPARHNSTSTSTFGPGLN